MRLCLKKKVVKRNKPPKLESQANLIGKLNLLGQYANSSELNTENSGLALLGAPHH
jgi:hypothetical protein